MTKINITVPRVATATNTHTGKNAPVDAGHEHHTSITNGGGHAEVPVLSPEELAKRAMQRFARAQKAARKRAKKAGKTPTDDASKLTAKEPEGTKGEIPTSSLFCGLVVPSVAGVVPVGQTRETYTAGQTLLKSADGLQVKMMNRQFDGFIADRFSKLEVNAAYAVANFPPKKQPAVQSLARNIAKVKTSYAKTLPMITEQLAKRNPKAPLIAVMMKAAELLDQEPNLARPLYIFNIYCEHIEQVRDNLYAAPLGAVEVFFEDAFQLYVTGDLHCGNNQPQLPTSTYKVGDVFMPRVTSSGLATYPGASGPIGANALQLPFEMLDCLMLILPLLGHEARHNVYHDVKGLEAELLDAVEKAIRAAHAAGVFKFASEEMMMGDQKVATIDLVVKLFCDWLSEVDADVVGGVLFSGTAFGGNMVMSFPAMMVRDGKVSDKVKLIRTESRFDLIPQPDGTTGLVFEEHPVDYVRIHIVAAALDEIGFAPEAAKLRELADFAVGDELPKEIVYKDAEGKSDLVIKFATADLLAVASTLVKAIIRTPLASQLGKSCGDLVMWDKKRQGKVDALANLLAAGVSELPTDQGSIFATYVGAAASQAYLQLVQAGTVDSVEAATTVNDAALKMIMALRDLPANQCPVPAPAQASSAPAVVVEAPAVVVVVAPATSAAPAAPEPSDKK